MNKKIVSGYSLIIGYLGIFMIMIGIIILLPTVMILFYPSEISEAKYFLIPGIISIIIGYFLNMMIRGKELSTLERHQDAILIFFIWILAIGVATIPFILSKELNFHQSFFETTSGFSTTGLTMVDVSSISHTFLFFRSIMQFFGGVGLVLVLTSAISDRYGMKLYYAEGHNDKLLPNLIKSARLILSIYLLYILVGTLLYVLFGMPLFDAINHAIASVSTGGFSTKAESIGYYNNVGIEVITIILMILGSTNVIIHFFLLKTKGFRVIKHVELKLFALLFIMLIPLLAINLVYNYQENFAYSLRVSIFQFFTSITTTGFQTVNDIKTLPCFFIVSMILLMVIGGGMGSTAGGIKQYRVVLAIKQIFWHIRDRIYHEKTIHTNFINRYGKEVIISQNDINNNSAYISIYLLILGLGTMIFVANGHSLQDSLFEFASALGTVGLSVGVLHSGSNSVMLWTAIVGMFLGRLEFYVVFIAITKLILNGGKKKVTQ
jgi:trk system potassium uptake protein